MSGAGYAYDWLRRRKREQLKQEAKEIEKKAKKVMKYRHSRSKTVKPRKRAKKTR